MSTDEPPVFEQEFRLEILDQMPANALVRYFPAARCERPLLVRFTMPNADPWIGGFGVGRLASRALSGVFGAPQRAHAYVVSVGRMYDVDVECPERTTSVDLEPVMQLVPAVSAGVLLVADPWQVHGYTSRGREWSTGRIATDGLTLVAVAGDIAIIRIETPDGELVEHRLNVRTGRLE